jgi:hypothetical protein
MCLIMAFWDIFKTPQKRFDRDAERWELEKRYLEQKFEDKAEFERNRRSIDLVTLSKEAELKQARLDFEIAEQKSKLEEALGDDDEEEQGGGEDAMFSQLIAGILTKKPENQSLANWGDSSSQGEQQQAGFSSPIPQSATNAPPVSTLELSDEQIRQIIKGLPKKYIEAARGYPDFVVEGFIKQKYPQIGADTMRRALGIIKGAR